MPIQYAERKKIYFPIHTIICSTSLFGVLFSGRTLASLFDLVANNNKCQWSVHYDSWINFCQIHDLRAPVGSSSAMWLICVHNKSIKEDEGIYYVYDYTRKYGMMCVRVCTFRCTHVLYMCEFKCTRSVLNFVLVVLFLYRCVIMYLRYISKRHSLMRMRMSELKILPRALNKKKLAQ